MTSTELTDVQWERLQPLLPPQKPRTGRPNKNHRTIINGILWVLRTGAPWRDLPERYGSWKTISSRFYRWQSAGVWQQILQKLQQRADREGKLDWSLHYVDSTVVRAHHHAAGAKGGTKGKRWAGVVAGSVQRCTCVPKVRASRSSSRSRVVSATSKPSSSR
jgi:transposase